MRLIGWILGLVLLLGGAAEAAAKPAITDARLGVEPGLTRVVISLSQRSDFRVFTLADPYRVVIDMSEVEWKVPSGTKLQGQGLVAGMRYGLFKAGTSRVVLDLMEPSEVARAEFVPAGNGEPLRLLVDLRPVPETQFRAQLKNSSVSYSAIAAIAPATKPAKTAARTGGTGSTGSGTGAATGALGGSAAKQPIEELKRGKPLIVIDPGHGGIDPGAVGSSINEKQLTLAVAKALKKELEDTGKFRVLLTRSRDVYIPLRERFGLAREKGADLFISLHADSLRLGAQRGSAVYTLSENASDEEAGRLASKENKSDILADTDLSHHDPVVTSILIDLAQRETNNRSIGFADLLAEELAAVTPLVHRHQRFAGFAVLKSPDTPSVLLELGYLSNRDDAHNLSQPGYRAKLAGAVLKALDRQFGWPGQ